MSTNQRFLALDVFRGMTICFMIIVNTPGNGPTTYAPLLHAHWNGFTPTDLVFPSFMFAVGNAMSFVMLKWSSLSQSQVLWKIFKRTALIFLLGYLMYWFPFFHFSNGHFAWNPISHTRIMGVLQRIAIAYGIASLLIWYGKPKWVLAITLLILVLYKYLLTGFGDLTLQGNAVLKLDSWLMGNDHLYHGEGVPFDPEGWLSTLPSIANVVLGYFVGKYIQQKGKSWEGLTHLLLLGFLLICLAYFWDLSFPINKKLWTSSFVLYTVGLDCVILAAIIYVIDMQQQVGWTSFFTVLGKNPLFIYLLSELGVTAMHMIHAGNLSLYSWLYQNIFKHAGAYFGSLLFAIGWMLTCWLVGYWMDKRKIYIRV